LWSYLIWYLSISILYFDSDPGLWLTALGISFIVGFALVLSTCREPFDLRALGCWQTLRLFLIPFCVSSYSLLIKDKNCFLIFPPDLKTNSIAIAGNSQFFTACCFNKKIISRYIFKVTLPVQ
jgi:hypothetical protein